MLDLIVHLREYSGFVFFYIENEISNSSLLNCWFHSKNLGMQGQLRMFKKHN